MKATKIGPVNPDSRGDQVLWELSNTGTFDEETFNYVITSAVHSLSTPETYVFESDSEGNVLSWMDLPGSFQGGLDHEEAIQGFCQHYKK